MLRASAGTIAGKLENAGESNVRGRPAARLKGGVGGAKLAIVTQTS